MRISSFDNQKIKNKKNPLFGKRKILKIVANIDIGYIDMPIPFFERKCFTIVVDAEPFKDGTELDKDIAYQRFLTSINGLFDRYKNQIIQDSEILKEYCFREEENNGGQDL